MLIIKKFTKIFALVAVIAILAPKLSIAEDKILVSSSIKPLHSLVSMVARTGLIVKGNVSPHNINLSAKTIAKLNDKSKVIFIISRDLEAPIYKAVKDKSKIYEVVKFKGIHLQPVNNGDQLFVKPGTDKAVKSVDPHLWLSPANAKVIVQNVADILSKQNPSQAKYYQKRASRAISKIEKLDDEIKQSLEKMPSKTYILYHDGFGYFESYYGLQNAGILTQGGHASHALSTVFSNKELLTLKKYVADHKVKCVFTEPQLKDLTLEKFAKDNKITLTTIDPIGSDIKPGKKLYFKLLKNISESINSCR